MVLLTPGIQPMDQVNLSFSSVCFLVQDLVRVLGNCIVF